MKLGDQLLARRLRRGDRDACRELVRAHHSVVFGYLRGLGADSALAEDLTQETYAKAWSKIDDLREACSLRAWLVTIARNEYLQWARRRRLAVVDINDVADPPADRPGIGEQLDRLHENRSLAAAVDDLDQELREVIALHYGQGLTLREVGSIQGIPTGTAKSRLSRALSHLRSRLGHPDHQKEFTPADLQPERSPARSATH